jgi:hypothetical protein
MRGNDIYYVTFYALYRVGVSDDPQMGKWKALVAISVLQSFVLIACDAWLGAIAGVNVFLGLPKYGFIAVCLSIIVLNYWWLLRHGQFEEFINRFDRLPVDKQERCMRVAWAVIGATVAVCFASVAAFRPPKPS